MTFVNQKGDSFCSLPVAKLINLSRVGLRRDLFKGITHIVKNIRKVSSTHWES